MAGNRTKTHHITAKTGKPPGMNYADFLQWKDMLYKQALEEAKKELNRVLGDRQAQRMGWLYVVALAEHGFTDTDLEELEQRVAALGDEYIQLTEANDQDYSDEKLRAAVSKALGREVRYIHDDLYPVNTDKKDDYITGLRESESRIY